MEINDNSGIRWEKLEELLKLSSLPPESMGELTEEEKNALLFLRRTRILIQQPDADRNFPVDEGWVKVQDHIDATGATGAMGAAAPQQAVPVRRIPRFRRILYAAAVLFPVMLAGLYWWGRQHEPFQGNHTGSAASDAVADLPPSHSVQLILAGGRRVELDSIQTLKEQNGATIRAGKGIVSYESAAGGVDAGAGAGKKTTSVGGPLSQVVFYNTLEVPRGNQSRLILPDGTKVWINAGSRLTYPTVFTGNTRELTMEGEAFFEVSKDEAHPFIVHAKDMAVKVLGTAFNINTYDPVLLTTLTEGKVNVSEAEQKEHTDNRQQGTKGGETAVVLDPGDQALFETGKKAIHKKSNVDIYLFTSWKDGIILYEEASFQKIAEQLGRQYDYNLVFDDPELANLHFTVNMKAPDKLQHVLNNIISTIEGVGFETTGREVRFFKVKQGK
jgi:ferric-dicitrate binding protein FerR (iron transport regulator)